MVIDDLVKVWLAIWAVDHTDDYIPYSNPQRRMK